MGEMADYYTCDGLGDPPDDDWAFPGLEPREDVWVTGDGRSLFVSEMTDSHIQNALQFLRRQVKARLDLATFAPPEVEEREAQLAHVEGWITTFVEELKRRGVPEGPLHVQDSWAGREWEARS